MNNKLSLIQVSSSSAVFVELIIITFILHSGTHFIPMFLDYTKLWTKVCAYNVGMANGWKLKYENNSSCEILSIGENEDEDALIKEHYGI